MYSEVARAIEHWHTDMVPAEAAAFAREVVGRAGPPSAARAKALLFAASRSARFALTAGLELRAEVVFCPAVIERFIVASAGVFSAPTARTLRTNCRSLGRALAAYPEPAPVRLPRERAKKPYSAEEISAYLALAKSQPTRERAMRTSALICLGAGAGVVGAELAGLRGEHVVARSGGVVVEVEGRRARAVPVLARYQALLSAAAGFAGPGYLLGGTGRSRRNVASALVGSLWGGADLARLEQARLRATWLGELAARLGLGAFMAAAGVDCSQRLGDIAAGLAALDEAETMRLLGGRAESRPGPGRGRGRCLGGGARPTSGLAPWRTGPAIVGAHLAGRHTGGPGRGAPGTADPRARRPVGPARGRPGPPRGSGGLEGGAP